jgi:hypothetical protein
MFYNVPCTDEVIGLVLEDEASALREQAAEVRECLRNASVPTWVFYGKYAMPYSEHLIPFRT